jgi:8-oxo-dGTP pyrophosphatase MutT (NUDIX family)
MRRDANKLIYLRRSALFFRGDKVLLCWRPDEENSWELPRGTSVSGEGSAAPDRREVAEETDLQISDERVAFVLRPTRWDTAHYPIEVIVRGAERDYTAEPMQLEDPLVSSFVSL